MNPNSTVDPNDGQAAGQGLGGRAVSAAQWRIASMAVQIVLAFPTGVLLARLLPPADFGLAALSLIVIGFVTLGSDLGLGSAIIQRRDLTTAHLRVALTGALLLGISIAAAVAVAAPAVARFARTPELAPVLRVHSMVFIAAGCDAVGRSILQRRLDFRRLYAIDLGSFSIGNIVVSVAAALAGLGVWSLVLGHLTQVAVSCCLSLRAAKVPLRPLLTRAELGELLGFGVSVSANNLVNYVARNGDNFVVGRLLGSTNLGYYSRAFNLMMMPLNYVTGALAVILVPMFAGLQDQRDRMRKGFLLSVQLATIVVLPVALGMLVAAPHLILGLYGERWAGAIHPLQVLCLIALPKAMMSLAGPVNRACNRVVTELWLQCGFAIAVVGAATAGSARGVGSVAVLVSVATGLISIGLVRLAMSLTGTTWRALLAAHLPGTLIALLSTTVIVLLRAMLERARWPHLPILATLVFAGAISVPLGLYLLPAAARPAELIATLMPSLKRLPTPLRTGAMFVLRTAP